MQTDHGETSTARGPLFSQVVGLSTSLSHGIMRKNAPSRLDLTSVPNNILSNPAHAHNTQPSNHLATETSSRAIFPSNSPVHALPSPSDSSTTDSSFPNTPLDPIPQFPIPSIYNALQNSTSTTPRSTSQYFTQIPVESLSSKLPASSSASLSAPLVQQGEGQEKYAYFRTPMNVIFPYFTSCS